MATTEPGREPLLLVNFNVIKATEKKEKSFSFIPEQTCFSSGEGKHLSVRQLVWFMLVLYCESEKQAAKSYLVFIREILSCMSQDLEMKHF